MIFESIILEQALKYSIPSKWIQAIIHQESRSNPYALRYEADYRWILTPEFYAKSLGISVDTEIQCQKMSWGLGQIMGALARELGHLGPMGELFLPELNIGYIAKRLWQIQQRSSSIDEMFAIYNGGFGARTLVDGKFKNQIYVDSVRHYLQNI